MDAPRRGGNVFRPSRAQPDLRVANNLPGRYPVEDWRAYYWAVADVVHEYAQARSWTRLSSRWDTRASRRGSGI